jgi:hypothetical protein
MREKINCVYNNNFHVCYELKEKKVMNYVAIYLKYDYGILETIIIEGLTI